MNEIINDWEPETRNLLALLLENNVTLLSGDNGEETFEYRGDLATFIDGLTACDESRVYVKLPDGKRGWLYLVFGNEPGVLVSDYSVHPVLDTVTDAHYELWDGRTQPTKRRAGAGAKTAAAVAVLASSERGQRVLRDFRALMDNGGFGLDSRGFAALATLAEAVQNGQRDFIGGLPTSNE